MSASGLSSVCFSILPALMTETFRLLVDFWDMRELRLVLSLASKDRAVFIVVSSVSSSSLMSVFLVKPVFTRPRTSLCWLPDAALAASRTSASPNCIPRPSFSVGGTSSCIAKPVLTRPLTVRLLPASAPSLAASSSSALSWNFILFSRGSSLGMSLSCAKPVFTLSLAFLFGPPVASVAASPTSSVSAKFRPPPPPLTSSLLANPVLTLSLTFLFPPS
mmetsp:Transcript_24395/g.44545  ORF Transcript_24395/g.44545 Transcript_24395/m.44545 type:complete len:219 (+) Transcript_24395:1163-1819(+)